MRILVLLVALLLRTNLMVAGLPSDSTQQLHPGSACIKRSFAHRMLVANGVMTASSVMALSGLIYYGGGLPNFSAMVSAENFRLAWTHPPVRDYDAPFYDYAVHPYMGQMFYLKSRNHGGKIGDSFLISVVCSTNFEYLIESFTQPPSINDLIVTPLLGSMSGEISYRILRRFRSDGHLNVGEKLVYLLLDPVEVMHQGFRCKKRPPTSY